MDEDRKFALLSPLTDGGEQMVSDIGMDGKEYPDPVPTAPPLGHRNPPDIMTMIRSMIRQEQFIQQIKDEGYETFEEAEDFDIEDDPIDAQTPYEAVFNPPPKPKDPPAGLTPVGSSPPSPSPSSPVPTANGGGEGGSPKTPPEPPALPAAATPPTPPKTHSPT